jgi:hypothetical protein
MTPKAHFRRAWRAVICMILLTLWMFDPRAFAATGFHGTVTFNGLAVPGAIVTATQGDKKEVAITDQQGGYTFDDIADGAWKLEVDMSGFETQTQDITVASGSAGPAWELKLLPLADITHGAAPIKAENSLPSAPAPSVIAGTPPSGNGTGAGTSSPSAAANAAARPAANTANNAPPPAAQTADASANGNASSSDLQQSAASSLVVNGSVNNGAASPFAQNAAFGNNRRGPGLFYNGNGGVNFDTSAWDARSFSPLGSSSSGIGGKPTYNQISFLANIGGPIGIPRHFITNSNFVVNYQHVSNDTASTASGLVPTVLERQGNFSQSLNAQGNPVEVYNPATNTPYAGETVPVSPQAQAFLNQYPTANVTGVKGINYERPAIGLQHSDALQARLAKTIKNRNQLNGSFGYQRQSSQSDANIFGFQDGSNFSGIDTVAGWTRTYRPGGIGYFNTLFQYEYNRLASSSNPFFANRTNFAGNAGIEGTDQTPQFWGPPALAFGTSGTAGLSDGAYSRSANDTQTVTYKSLWYRGKHTFQFGGDLARLQFNSHSQQAPRGSFSFNGDATRESGDTSGSTGSDLADFILGVPDTATIAFGNADKYLRGWRADAFINDDFRLKAGLTVDAGLRWEFSSPVTELKNRLANIDVSSGFASAAPVAATDPTGSITGRNYPSSLLNADYRGIEPRLAIAWRPRSNSPLVVRAGYGIYQVTSVYQVIATQMAQEPPFSKAFDLTNSAATPLELATAFTTLPAGVANTFGVDPNFRIGYVHLWNASIQQDLPGSLVMTVTYAGTKGTHLMQEFMPNMYPQGSPDACTSCPSGFVYLTSGANQEREAGVVQLRRRLRDGFTATLQYTYAKSLDDASAFSGAAITSGGSALSSVSSSSGGGSTSIAQNWTNLRAERGLSTFDQRNQMTFTAQYTTGEGLRAGALMSGWRGTLFKDWTFLTSLTVGSGLPLTPIYELNQTGIGIPWIIRPNTTGISAKATGAGENLNEAAFAAPATGQFGNAGRDSVTGPPQFGLDASFSRTFRLNSRLDATWTTQATNILNTVTATSWNPSWGQAFGATTAWNGMRRLQTTVRVRF